MSSVIFIGSPEKSLKESKSPIFTISFGDFLWRVWASFVPPLGLKYRKIYVDLLGPVLGFFCLTSFLIYGNSFKKNKIVVTPVEIMVAFGTVMPCFCYILAKLGKSSVNLYETVSLVGYSLYGHLFTLLVSFIFFHETSNAFFFVSLIVFGGSSTLRLILVFLKTIPVPGMRLLICSIISLVNILFLIFLHFGLMHRTFS